MQSYSLPDPRRKQSLWKSEPSLLRRGSALESWAHSAPLQVSVAEHSQLLPTAHGWVRIPGISWGQETGEAHQKVKIYYTWDWYPTLREQSRGELIEELVFLPFPRQWGARGGGHPSRKENTASYLPTSAPRRCTRPHLVPGNDLNLSMHVPALASLLCIMGLQVCLC